MKIGILAVGKLKDGPERLLVARYLERARDVGRGLGWTGFDVTELAESRSTRPDDRKADEARAIIAHTDGAVLCALDERGTCPSSTEFARLHERWQEQAVKSVIFVIGGADGLDRSVVEKARHQIAFGAMTLPHQVVRIVLAEQLYRAMTILSGHPYHRI